MEEIKNTKKYKCRISEQEIFWTINSVDKIDKNTFNKNYVPNFKDVDFIPNFIDQFTISLALDKATYTMVEITDVETNEIMYFLNSNISKKMDKGFICQFDLDVYLTYAWDYYKFLATSKFMDTAHVNRAMLPCLWNWDNPYNTGALTTFTQTSKMLQGLIIGQKDPLVNYENGVSVVYSEKIKPQYTKLTVMTNLSADGSATNVVTNLSTTVMDIYFENVSTRKKPLCYVYELPNGTYMCIIRYARGGWMRQALPYNKLSTNAQKTLDNNFNRANIYDYYLSSQDPTYINLGAKITFLANKFVGCFEVPFINAITEWFIWNGSFVSGSSTNRAFTDGCVMGFFIDRDGGLQLGRYNSNSYDTNSNPIYTPKINNQTIDTDNERVINLKNPKSIISFMVRYAKVINFNYSVSKQSDYFNSNYLTFDGTTFNLVNECSTDTNLNAYVPGAIINQLRGTINISTDSYNEYVAQTQIVQNTGLQIARQQYNNSAIDMTLNTIGTMLNAMGGIGNDLYNKKVPSAAKMLSLGGIFSFISDGYQNIRNMTQKYYNYVKIQEAANQTARVTATANNIASSVVTDDSWVKMGLFLSSTYDTGIQNRYGISFTLDFNRIQADLWFLLNYGFYINQTLSIQQVFQFFNLDSWPERQYYNNPYVYMDFNFPTEKYCKIWKPNANSGLIEAINTLNKNSMRIWKESPKKIADMTSINIGLSGLIG